jgi:hypothetical protein
MAILALAAGSQMLAQGVGEIHGKVLDDAGEALPFCVVRAGQGRNVLGAQTDFEGRFVLKPLPVGAYTVSFQYPAYGTVEITDVRVDPGLITSMKDAVLHTELGIVEVVRYKWEEPLIRPDDPSRMVMTTAQIKTNATRKDPVKMIASMTPGVTKAANSDELYFRGSRSGSMAYFVDGVKVLGNNPGVPSDAINSVSVYTGGLPAKYGDVTGGVVAIETKSFFDLWQQRNSGR